MTSNKARFLHQSQVPSSVNIDFLPTYMNFESLGVIFRQVLWHTKDSQVKCLLICLRGRSIASLYFRGRKARMLKGFDLVLLFCNIL